MILQNNKILIWNCRGAASNAFYRFCKQYVVANKPDILVILETRCDPEKLRKTFNLLGYNGYDFTEVRGYAGGNSFWVEK
jgi:exonuclease III